MKGNNIIATAASMLEDVYDIQYSQACIKIMDTVKSIASRGGTNVCFKAKFFADNTPLVNVDELINELNMKGYETVKNGNEILIDWSKAEPLNTFKPFAQIKPETTVGTPEIC